ncbi:MAG: hypothetical protein EZS28_018679 [Streblomastix strix]|uniref:Uncharacterized protein n=1 Tax=Streblomastix strix TaxID=222440 RepID=A0A5J4VU13_9EUKA|nr:MAG: hypothetical protein EZS28_018679 [Streblomastix strix]
MDIDQFVQPNAALQDVILGDNAKGKREAAGKALATLIGYFNKDVKRNRELTSLPSAQQYITRHPKLGYRVEAQDLDNDVDTPDNTVVYRKNGNIYAVDGFYTVPGFGGLDKNKHRIYKSRDTLAGYYGSGDYETRRANRGRDKKIAVDESLLTPYQRYAQLAKGNITADNHWIASDKMPSEYNAFKKLVAQNMDSIRAGSSKNVALVSKLASQLWNEILLQVTRQFDPQGARIQEYRNDHADTQAQLDDLTISKRIFNTKKNGQRLYAAAHQLIANIQGNIKQTLIERGFQ